MRAFSSAAGAKAMETLWPLVFSNCGPSTSSVDLSEVELSTRISAACSKPAAASSAPARTILLMSPPLVAAILVEPLAGAWQEQARQGDGLQRGLQQHGGGDERRAGQRLQHAGRAQQREHARRHAE